MTSEADLLRTFKQFAAEPIQQTDQYQEILERFVKVLHAGFPDAGASVDLVGGRATWALNTWPSLRPEERTMMLSFKRAHNGVQVFGEKQSSLRSPEALWEYLVKFGKSEGFRQALQLYKLQNTEPAVGMLRTISPIQIMDDDAIVNVEADQIRSICNTILGNRVTVRMRPEPRTSYRPFVVTGGYRFLLVVGFVVEIASDGISEVEGEIVVAGSRTK